MDATRLFVRAASFPYYVTMVRNVRIAVDERVCDLSLCFQARINKRKLCETFFLSRLWTNYSDHIFHRNIFARFFFSNGRFIYLSKGRCSRNYKPLNIVHLPRVVASYFPILVSPGLSSFSISPYTNVDVSIQNSTYIVVSHLSNEFETKVKVQKYFNIFFSSRFFLLNIKLNE